MSSTEIILISSAICIFSILLTYLITKRGINKGLDEYKSISEALAKTKKGLSSTSDLLENAKAKLSAIEKETQELQCLKENGDILTIQVKKTEERLNELEQEAGNKTNEIEERNKELHDLMSKLDLYTRIDEFVDHGFFEIPEYLYETSARFTEEIKRVRETQKDYIKAKTAIEYPSSLGILPDNSQNRKVIEGQIKLMLTAFNIECDALIGKVNPSSFSRTLERIEKLANNLEKSAATLKCGFNLEYIELKFEECRLQYQYSLRRQEEQEEQRMIREQIREEQKAIREYERALSQAEKEERLYRDLLERAREELSKATDGERIIFEQRIAELEFQLAEAMVKEERAKSMAEQTRKGHVYIISNLGSFGHDIYKIGLTRRLDPMDRVKELGDASVPFRFDVHAIIFSDDAPALEAALHREFNSVRVNAVNYRKEFFNVDLKSIKEAVEKIAGTEAEFKMTAVAEEYFETRRLQGPKNGTQRTQSIFTNKELTDFPYQAASNSKSAFAQTR